MGKIEYSNAFQKYLVERKKEVASRIPFPWDYMQNKSRGIRKSTLYFIAGEKKNVMAVDMALAFTNSSKKVAYISTSEIPEDVKNISGIATCHTTSFEKLQAFVDSVNPDMLVVEDLQDFTLTAEDVANDEEVVQTGNQCVVPNTIGGRAYSLKRWVMDHHTTAIITMDMYDFEDPVGVSLDDFYDSIGWASCAADMVIALRKNHTNPNYYNVFVLKDRHCASPPYHMVMRLDSPKEHFLDVQRS